MAMRTPPRASMERDLGRVTPTPQGPRYRPSYIPLPTPVTTSSTTTAAAASNGVRAGSSGQQRSSESGDDSRTGRSSSLSVRTSSPALVTTGIPRPSARPSFSLHDGGPLTMAGGHQRTCSNAADNESSGRNSIGDEAAGAGVVDDGERILPVKVAVRIRPLAVNTTGEQLARGALTSCLEAVAGGTISVSGSSLSQLAPAEQQQQQQQQQRAFHFDHAFGPEASQAAVYEACVLPLLQRFVEGYNVTVLAYGQTSSGKTYTMGTESDDGSGVVPRALRWLFAWWAGQPDAARLGGSVRISFLEVYNDELIDLVAQTRGGGHVRPPVFVREDAKGHVVWTGVKEVLVADADAALAILADGSRERQTGGTRMNEKSSRSHAIYSVTLAQARVVSKLHFVDLAGSERLKKTLAVGERQREGIAINSGLLALGNVISALGDPARRQASFVPYRDSKLTHMLRDSLGGSAQTLLIACVSQAEANVAESLNTLKYAARARNIRNRGGVNVVATRASSREVDALRAVVRRLKAEIHVLTDKLQATATAGTGANQAPRLAFSPTPVPPQTADAPPSKIPTVGSALHRRLAQAEESGVLRARNQALEGELEQLNDTYTELLLKFNDACREIEDRHEEGFARDQRLRDREQEIRRLTAHSRRATADHSATRQSLRVDSSVGDSPPAESRPLPDLARLRMLRSESTGGGDAPGAAEFDAVLEECDAKIRHLEAELLSASDALAAVRLQLDMQETRALFADKLTTSQVAQIDALRAQLAKARDAGLAEEERRRAADAELEDAALAYEAQLEAVANEWRQELQNVDEQWNERWDAADAERTAQIKHVEQSLAEKIALLESENAVLRSQQALHEEEIEGVRMAHGEEIARIRSDNEEEIARVRSENDEELARLRSDNDEELARLRLSPPVVTQLLSPPPTAGDNTPSLYAELEKSSHLKDEVALLKDDLEKSLDEAERLRAQTLDAEARASAAEAALAALSSKLTADRIVLCARSSMATDAVVTPSELRLRNVRHRYSTVAHAQQLQQQHLPDRYASYPELRLASSEPRDSPPVYDEDQIQRMLRDAAAQVDSDSLVERADEAAAAEIARLKESKKDLQERNSQMQNLMRDLGDRLVGLAEENDQLEIRANDRDQLHAEVQRLTQELEKAAKHGDGGDGDGDDVQQAATSRQRRHSIESFRSADTSNAAAEQLQTRLDIAEAELAAATQSSEEHQNHVTELLHDAEVFRRRIQDLDDDLAQTMRQLDDAREDSRRVEQLARAHAE
ncbi:hypothetical protein GGI21_002517, partial [Coemansia aciculifera]